jgi:ribosomal protein L9
MKDDLQTAYGASMLDPENATDPTKRLMQMLMLSGGMGGNPSLAPITAGLVHPGQPSPTPLATPPSTDTAGATATDETGRLFTGEVMPPQPGPSALADPSMTSRIRPAGFDEGGMPTEYPATSRMNTARDMLEKAKHPPHDLRNKLIIGGLGTLGALLAARGGNTYAGAGAAQGLSHAFDTMYDRQQTNIGRNQQMYEFEAGQEEKQREAALREKVAMSQLEATRAYRDLLIAMRSRGQDVTMRGQDIGANKAGYNVDQGASQTGAPTLTPKSVDELPEIQQARIAAQEAMNENTKVRTEKGKEQLAGGALNVQDQMWKKKNYEARIMGIEAMKELRQQGLALQGQRMEMPTASVRTMGETAATVLPHIEDLRGLIAEADKQGLLGPLRGRVSAFLAGRVGTTGDAKVDALLGKLRSSDSFMSSAMVRTHFGARGGQQMYGKFIEMLDTGKSTPEMLNGALDTFESYAKGYAQAAGVDIDNYNQGGATIFNPSQAFKTIRPQSPVNKLQKKGAPSGSGSVTPPAGAKIRKWSEFTNAPAATATK